MTEQFYRKSDLDPHGLITRPDGTVTYHGVLIPGEPDYEAAERVAFRSLWADKRSYVRAVVDAALRIGGSDE